MSNFFSMKFSRWSNPGRRKAYPGAEGIRLEYPLALALAPECGQAARDLIAQAGQVSENGLCILGNSGRGGCFCQGRVALALLALSIGGLSRRIVCVFPRSGHGLISVSSDVVGVAPQLSLPCTAQHVEHRGRFREGWDRFTALDLLGGTGRGRRARQRSLHSTSPSIAMTPNPGRSRKFSYTEENLRAGLGIAEVRTPTEGSPGALEGKEGQSAETGSRALCHSTLCVRHCWHLPPSVSACSRLGARAAALACG